MSNGIHLNSWGNPQRGKPKKGGYSKFIESLKELEVAGLVYIDGENKSITVLNKNPGGQICRERKSKQEIDDDGGAEQQERAAYAHLSYITDKAKIKDPNEDFYKGLVDDFSIKKDTSLFRDLDGCELSFKGGDGSDQPMISRMIKELEKR